MLVQVLDVGPGTGFISACLQTGGYACVDALDDDLPTLRNLQALRLYRNYICREFTGVNWTGDIRQNLLDTHFLGRRYGNYDNQYERIWGKTGAKHPPKSGIINKFSEGKHFLFKQCKTFK